MHDENGVRLTILEQCRILKLSRATYYECCKFEAERQKKKAGEKRHTESSLPLAEQVHLVSEPGHCNRHHLHQDPVGHDVFYGHD